ncbi:ATP-binding protein [Aliikangiella sp. G2MR2-5]|uniref:ATP-binding protein n=1 Tax=Aliikangiella sp. G2MR2-5 TaxID=2788943 RepID=UPI0018ABD88D|nr:ATP-binding protein [Aliikangiella sp. G2MR2-5]
MTLSQQIFLKLYLVVISSIVLVGWGINYFWQNSSDSIDELDAYKTTINLLSTKSVKEDWNSIITKYNQISKHHFSIVSLSEIHGGSLVQQLQNNNIISVDGENSQLTFYKKVEGQELVLMMQVKQEESNESSKLYWLVLFYCIVAILVYLWTRPLARDLKRLQDAASAFEKKQFESRVEVSKGSSVASLANAFNQLLDRIGQLIKDQKEMSHAISHELRTPLARIRFSLEMISKTECMETIKSKADSIREDISEIQLLVDELLNFSALDKTVALNKEKGDLSKLIESLTEKLKQNIADKEFSISLPSLSKAIYCDGYLIERAIQNLLVNAGKYAKNKVSVSLSYSEESAIILVEDDGKGIEKKYRDKIFESFFQIKSTGDHKKGFGLGLAIVKKIIDIHKGSISVETSSLNGALFKVVLPLREEN